MNPFRREMDLSRDQVNPHRHGMDLPRGKMNPLRQEMDMVHEGVNPLRRAVSMPGEKGDALPRQRVTRAGRLGCPGARFPVKAEGIFTPRHPRPRAISH